MPKYRCKYEYTNAKRHVWSVVGRHLAIHLHISEPLPGMDYEPSGGIEIHYRQPPHYMEDDPPSHENCMFLGGPCWHDGSSHAASEVWIPRWQANPHDHERMFDLLKGEVQVRTEEFLAGGSDGD